MANKRSKTREGRPCFSQVWTPLLARLVTADLTGSEWAVLVALMRFQRVSDDGTVTLSRPASEIVEDTGLRPSTVRNVLYNLRRDGALIQTSKGHNGRCAVHVLSWRADGSPMEVGSSDSDPTSEVHQQVGSSDSDPTGKVGSSKTTSRVVKAMTPLDVRRKSKTHTSPSLVRGDADATIGGGSDVFGGYDLSALERHDPRP